MSSRRPAEPHYSGRATGALPRSPAERLEPTRPAARARRPRFSREPGTSTGLSRIISGVFTLLLLLMAIAGGAALVLQSWLNAPGPLVSSKEIVIPRGESAHAIAARLEREGVISDRRLFIGGYLLARMTGWSGRKRPVHLMAGDYRIPQKASIRQVIDMLVEGRTITYRVTIPEGLTSYQIVERLKADDGLAGDITEVPPEGALLPETFIVRRGAKRQTIIDNMRNEARKLARKLWTRRRKGLPFKTWEEALVLASIVEKETGRNDERERVAAVFVNRLRKGMRLDSDPTILYGIDGGKTDWGRPILRSEIRRETAHNTYQIDGLPPTPICNPGKAAIAAVLNPAETDEFYFVANGKGGHMFAETLKEHNANVVKWRAIEKEMKAKASAQGPTAAAPDKAPEADKDKADKGKPDKDKPDKDKPDKDKPDKDKADNDKGEKSTGATSKAGSWASTTEPAPAKSKR